MFSITNLSNNPLTLTDGTMLAAGASRKAKSVSDAEKNFEQRGWLSIIEEKPEEKDGGKK